MDLFLPRLTDTAPLALSLMLLRHLGLQRLALLLEAADLRVNPHVIIRELAHLGVVNTDDFTLRIGETNPEAGDVVHNPENYGLVDLCRKK